MAHHTKKSFLRVPENPRYFYLCRLNVLVEALVIDPKPQELRRSPRLGKTSDRLLITYHSIFIQMVQQSGYEEGLLNPRCAFA